jgi:hypothetical protein
MVKFTRPAADSGLASVVLIGSVQSIHPRIRGPCGLAWRRSFSAFAAFVAAADADEHVGGFDDRANFEPFFQAERFHGLSRDDGNDFRSAGERDDDFGIDRAGGDFF